MAEALPSPQGPYLDLSGHFPEGVFAYVLLKGNAGVDAETLLRFLGGRGRRVRAVHRVEQVHSARVVEAGEAPCEADAVVVRTRGHAARVVTADCVPLLLARGDGAAAAAVHAGWKGTLGRIAERAARHLAGEAPGGLRAYLGPAVGPCCYGVDAERHRLFAEAFGDAVVPPPSAHGYRLDLRAINGAQLRGCGAGDIDILSDARCTACTVALCCSYRRDGERAGRMAAVVGLDG